MPHAEVIAQLAGPSSDFEDCRTIWNLLIQESGEYTLFRHLSEMKSGIHVIVIWELILFVKRLYGVLYV